MTETTKTTNLVALDPWDGDYPEARFCGVHVFDTTDKLNRYLKHADGFVTIDTEKASEAIDAERGITTYGDFTADDLDDIFHEDGHTWKPWINEYQDVAGTKRMVWVLIPDDPRTADHVAYVERFGKF